MSLILLKDVKKIIKLATAVLLLVVISYTTIYQAFHQHTSVKKNNKHSALKSYQTSVDKEPCSLCDFAQNYNNCFIECNQGNYKLVIYYIKSVQINGFYYKTTNKWLFPPSNSPPLG